MRILVDMVHPSNVFFFREAIRMWNAGGHDVYVTGREKDVLAQLLTASQWPHEIISTRRAGLLSMATELLQRDLRLTRIIRRRDVDVLAGFSAAAASQAGFLTRRKTAAFYDTEHARLINGMTLPFCSIFCTPESYPLDHGRKHRRFRGNKEAAYLHPKYFQPDAGRLRDAGLEVDAPYAVVRLTSWNATHDAGYRPITLAEKIRLVEALGAKLRIFITSEGPLPPALEHWRLRAPPHLLHDLLAFARVAVGDGTTTIAEAALLGTPGVYISPLRAACFTDLATRFGLVHDIEDFGRGLELATRLVDEDAKSAWRAKADAYFDWADDVPAYVHDTVLELGE